MFEGNNCRNEDALILKIRSQFARRGQADVKDSAVAEPSASHYITSVCIESTGPHAGRAVN